VEPVGFERKVMHRCTIGIAINKSYRNKGLGTQMTALCMDLAGALGYNVMEIGVNSKNTLALSVLNRTGWRIMANLTSGYHQD
jgi:RimJ/RimL family protein N-acetyltransferase